MHSTKRLLVALAAVAATACSGGARQSDGSVNVTVAAAGSGVATTVWIRVYGNGIDQTVQATPDAQARNFTASFARLPAGSYLVHGWGYDQSLDTPPFVPPNPATYENRDGDIPLVIVAGQNTQLDITLREVNPAGTTSHAPVISFISASAFDVEVGGTAVTLTSRATDADGNLLDWTWSDGGAGTFSVPGGSFSADPQTFSTTWTPLASTTGLVTISLTVTDGTLNASTITITLNVVPAGNGTGSATIIAHINALPAIVEPLTVTNGQIPPNTLTTFFTSAYDPDPADALTFSYANDCGGQFASQAAVPFDDTLPVGPGNPLVSSVDFLAPSPAPSSGLCTVSVTAADGRGSSVVQNLVITIGNPLIAYAPEFTLETFAIPATSGFFPAAPGTTVNFQAQATQQVDGSSTFLAPAAFTWTFPEGTPADVSSGTLSIQAWTVPAAPALCTVPGQIVQYSASVAVQGATPTGVDPSLMVSTRTITIDVACP